MDIYKILQGLKQNLLIEIFGHNLINYSCVLHMHKYIF